MDRWVGKSKDSNFCRTTPVSIYLLCCCKDEIKPECDKVVGLTHGFTLFNFSMEPHRRERKEETEHLTLNTHLPYSLQNQQFSLFEFFFFLFSGAGWGLERMWWCKSWLDVCSVVEEKSKVKELILYTDNSTDKIFNLVSNILYFKIIIEILGRIMP